MPNRQQNTYDFTCFKVLAEEYPTCDPKDIEKKIRRRLKYHRLGILDQQRIDYLRTLKDTLFAEFRALDKSKYYHKTDSKFAVMADFNLEQMQVDFLIQFNQIDQADMIKIMTLTVHLGYLR